ncbi:glycoside hydrolase family 3 protein [Streptomyces sioyaensis]|uniref:glycoside hydrolase family 3 protein n=1 Tax=Streptomyces sioyaensis TaxID=67364 RepID=UPI0037D72B4A
MVTVAITAAVTTSPDHGEANNFELASKSTDRWVQETLRGMSLEEKVGQLFVADTWGSSPDQADDGNIKHYGVSTPADVVKKYHLGGVIYINSGTIANPKQVAHLSNGLQTAAVTSGAKIPLLISADQEYGTVVRIGPPATQFPGAMALGATGRPDLARKAAEISGRELNAMGVNQNDAPDADVNINPANPVIGLRSFSSDPRWAAKMVSAQVKGFQSAHGGRTVAVAKHFPGHGDTDVDSHTDVPVVNHTKKEWEKLDAPPFRAAIKSGVDTIMTGHLVMPKIDPSGTPATLSTKLLTGLLRGELGYNGVVETDALNMAGVRKKYGDDKVPVMALKAGADELLMPPNMDVAYQAVLKAVKSGELTEHRIDQSVTRILRMKKNHGITVNPMVDEGKVDRVVGTATNLEQAQAITNRTTTLIKNGSRQVPIRNKTGKMLVAGASTGARNAFTEEAKKRHTQAVPLDIDDGRPVGDVIKQAVQGVSDNDLTVVLTQDATTDPNKRQQQVVEAMLDASRKAGKPIIVVGVGKPYDISMFPDAPVYLNTYSRTPVAMSALANVLYGEVRPSGKLPVSIPSADGSGKILYRAGYGLTH